MNALGRVILFVAGVLPSVAGIACRREAPPPPRRASRAAASQWLRAADAAEAPLERALTDFDAAASGPGESRDLAAGAVLSAARSARETLESVRVPPDLEYARWEELVFLNHLVPGFQAFLAGKGTAADLRTLSSVRERALTHRRRGREAIGTP